MHSYLKSHPETKINEPEDARPFCNSMFALPSNPNPCDERYPYQRYSQINLMPLTRYGTIEFRPHSATVKLERVARWVQFLTAFVEHFGNTDEGLSSTKAFFDDDFESDFADLREAQRSAKLAELFEELGSKVDSQSLAYYEERRWEEGDAICDAEKKTLLDTLNDANASEQSLLQLRGALEVRKAASRKRELQTPIQIRVPVPMED